MPNMIGNKMEIGDKVFYISLDKVSRILIGTIVESYKDSMNNIYGYGIQDQNGDIVPTRSSLVFHMGLEGELRVWHAFKTICPMAKINIFIKMIKDAK